MNGNTLKKCLLSDLIRVRDKMQFKIFFCLHDIAAKEKIFLDIFLISFDDDFLL